MWLHYGPSAPMLTASGRLTLAEFAGKPQMSLLVRGLALFDYLSGRLPACVLRTDTASFLCEDGIDLHAFARNIAGVSDDGIAFIQSGQHFEAVTIVAAGFDLLKVHSVVGADDRDLRSIGADNERLTGDEQGRVGANAAQLDVRVHARHQFTATIGQKDFDQERAAGRVERIRSARNRPFELASGKVGHGNDRLLGGPDGARINLRNVQI